MTDRTAEIVLIYFSRKKNACTFFFHAICAFSAEFIRVGNLRMVIIIWHFLAKLTENTI